jgi:hypothetical protein
MMRATPLFKEAMQQTTDFLARCGFAARQQPLMRACSAVFLLSLYVLLSLRSDCASGAEPPPVQIERYIAVDNVCAWPNLTRLKDGSIAAIIHNQPSHGRIMGDLDCWVSKDGNIWEKRGHPAPDDPGTVRMNVAAGRAANGDLVVLCSGWNRDPVEPSRVLPPWVSRSSDAGLAWEVLKSFPVAEDGWTDFVPFGPILPGEDGRLHTTCYARGLKDPKARHVWHFTSADDGRTWQRGALIGADHNETSIFHLGGRRWLAAARNNAAYRMVLFRSDDDGATWHGGEPITETRELNAHLLRLADGRILLSYGKRLEGQSGVLAKFSNDEGRTWSGSVRLTHSLAMDCGYPSSVQRADGRIVTAFYSAAVENHQRYHMGVAIWTAPAREP